MDNHTSRVEFVALTNKYGALNLGQVSLITHHNYSSYTTVRVGHDGLC